MRYLSYTEFLQESSAFEAAVAEADYVATFCSGTAWQTAACDNLFGEDFGIAEPISHLILENDGCWLTMVERYPGVYFPLESAWMFGCPLIGEPEQAIQMLLNACKTEGGAGRGFVISGVRENSEMYRLLIKLAQEQSHRWETFPTTDCLTIDLSDGFDAYLSRRSKSFRKSIRQQKDLPGLAYVDASTVPADEVFDRIFAIQAKTHKAAAGEDIFSQPSYQHFYRDLYAKLLDQRQIRTVFAQVDGVDAAYIMGGVASGIYRGFQMSYDEAFRSYSLGNRLQLENMKLRAEEGATLYDLGMHSEYKERWADNWQAYRGVFMVL